MEKDRYLGNDWPLMSYTDLSNESNPRNVDLANFIKKNSALLTVMGIFAAISVYITQAAPSIGTNTESELIAAIGFVSALGMSMLFLLFVYKELASETGSGYNLLLAHFRIDNFELAFFTIFNVMLIMSISYLMTMHSPAIFVIILVATVFAGTGVMIRIMNAIGKLLPESPWARLSVFFSTSLVALIASSYAIMYLFDDVQISTIHEMSFSEPVPVVIAVAYLFIAAIRSGAGIGIVISIIGVPIIFADKFRGSN